MTKWIRIGAVLLVLLLAASVVRGCTLDAALSEAREATAIARDSVVVVKAEIAAVRADTARFRARQDSLGAETDTVMVRLAGTVDTIRVLAEGHGDTALVRMIDSVEVRAQRAVATERERAELAEARVDSLTSLLFRTEARYDTLLDRKDDEIAILEKKAYGFRLFGIPLRPVVGAGLVGSSKGITVGGFAGIAVPIGG